MAGCKGKLLYRGLEFYKKPSGGKLQVFAQLLQDAIRIQAPFFPILPPDIYKYD